MDTAQIIGQIFSLLFSAIAACLVWRYYRGRLYGPWAKYSTFGPRFWTGTVDGLVLWPLSFIGALVMSTSLPRAVGIGWVLLQQLLWLSYTVVLHARYGQTIGKRVCKVRVVDFATEGAITFRQAFLRESLPLLIGIGSVAYETWYGFGSSPSESVKLGQVFLEDRVFWVLTSLPLLWFVAEVLTMLTNDKRRALHDYIAGTVVIRTNVG